MRDLAVTAVAANGYYVQVPPDSPDYAGAANSGLFVFSGTGPKPAAGDRVDVEGTLTNYYGRLELTDTVFTPAGTSGASPEPAIVEPVDAATASAVVNGVAVAGALQSVLIKVQNVTVTNASPAVNEFEVTGGLPVDDLLYRLDPLPSVGQTFSSITGVLNLYLNRYALEPRGAAIDVRLVQVGDERREARGELVLLAAHRPGVVDHEEHVGGREIRQRDALLAGLDEAVPHRVEVES
jgi:predicted extracellular nuclease